MSIAMHEDAGTRAGKPRVTCLMMSSVDGGLHPSKWTKSPDGDPKAWSALYEAYQDSLGADAWLVGRTTMAEMSKAGPHPVAHGPAPARPLFKAPTDRRRFAVAFDTSGKLHFSKPVVQDQHVVVILGADASDDHLRELAADGVSYWVADDRAIDPAAALAVLARDFGIGHLMLEGGAEINGALFAAGLVDELQVIVGPGLDARAGAQRIVEHGDDGLAGKVELSFESATPMERGCVRLAYRVHAHGG